MFNLYVDSIRKKPKSDHTVIIKGTYNREPRRDNFVIEYYGAGIDIKKGELLFEYSKQIESKISSILKSIPCTKEDKDVLKNTCLHINTRNK
ncbi:hypothetical protein [Lysinibacillus capsici]|uniref:hypothetical protein n=1 Tax=Lysinibacillus capsici TaxID=2115968 RepID=UPI0028A03F3E|nr:hypothetical protein [Lysinibacillus capsici]